MYTPTHAYMHVCMHAHSLEIHLPEHPLQLRKDVESPDAETQSVSQVVFTDLCRTFDSIGLQCKRTMDNGELPENEQY